MEYLFLSGIIISLFLTLLLLPKGNKTVADYILMAWLLFSGYNLLAYYLVYTNQLLDFPDTVVLGLGIPLLQGPFLYLYIKYQTNLIAFRRRDLLHFIPFILCTGLYAGFFLLSFDEKVQLLKGGATEYDQIGFIKLIAIYVSGIVYIPLSFLKLRLFRKNLKYSFSNTERIHFNWLLYQIIGLAVVWIVVLFIQDDKFIFGSAAIFILWLGYFGINQAKVFNHSDLTWFYSTGHHLETSDQPAKEPDEQLLNEAAASAENEPLLDNLYHRLNDILQEEKPYLNPELKLLDLAKLLDIHPNVLSKVINVKAQKSFYDLINEKRVETFLLKLKEPKNSQYTLLALAYDSGFNSKASFQRNFKKITAMTPSEYLNQHAAPKVSSI